jgi:hypothetical protein
MRNTAYVTVSATLFTLIALVQYWRAASGLPVQVGPWSLPLAASWIAGTVAALLAFWGWRSRRPG